MQGWGWANDRCDSHHAMHCAQQQLPTHAGPSQQFMPPEVQGLACTARNRHSTRNRLVCSSRLVFSQAPHQAQAHSRTTRNDKPSSRQLSIDTLSEQHTWQEGSLPDIGRCGTAMLGGLRQHAAHICPAEQPLLEVFPLPRVHDPEVVQRLHMCTVQTCSQYCRFGWCNSNGAAYIHGVFFILCEDKSWQGTATEQPLGHLTNS